MATVGQTVSLKRGGAPQVIVKIVNEGVKEYPEGGQLLMLKRCPSDMGGFFWENEVEVVTQ